MANLVTLQDIEAYNREVESARVEDRVPVLYDPRKVAVDDPNAETFLKEKSKTQVKKETKERQEEKERLREINEKAQQAAESVRSIPDPEVILPDTATSAEIKAASSKWDDVTLPDTSALDELLSESNEEKKTEE